MKKVLLVVPLSTLDWGSKNAGGIDSVCQMLVKHLTEREACDYCYRVLAFDPFCAQPYSSEVLTLSSSVEVVVCPTNEKRWGLKLPGIFSQFLRIKEQVIRFQPDVVHGHVANWLLGIGPQYQRLATLHSYKWIGRKPVSTCNDFVHTKIVPWLANYFIDQYTCVGETLKSALENDVCKAVKVIGNPIDGAYFPKQIHAKLKDGTLRLVTCALISRRKKIDHAIALVSELVKQGRSVSLRVIGPNVDPEYFAELEQQVRSLGLQERVVFVGALNRDEISAEYQRSNIGVYFSSAETFGLAPLEMLAAELPLLTTKVGILAEREKDFVGVGVEFVDGEDIEGQMCVLDRLALINSTKAREYITANFSSSGVVDSYECLYQEKLLNVS